MELLLVTQEYDFDLCVAFAGGSYTVACLWPVTDMESF